MRQILFISLITLISFLSTVCSAEIDKVDLNGNLEDIKRVLEHNPTLVNKTVSGRSTLLHQALTLRRKDVVKLLIDKGVNVNDIDNNGNSPLDLAIKNKKSEIVDLLRMHGAKKGTGYSENLRPAS